MEFVHNIHVHWILDIKNVSKLDKCNSLKLSKMELEEMRVKFYLRQVFILASTLPCNYITFFSLGL